MSQKSWDCFFEKKKAPAGSLGPQKAYIGAQIDWDFSKYKDLGLFEKSIFPKNPQTGFFEEKKAPAGSLGPQKAYNGVHIPYNIIYLETDSKPY